MTAIEVDRRVGMGERRHQRELRLALDAGAAAVRRHATFVRESSATLTAPVVIGAGQAAFAEGYQEWLDRRARGLANDGASLRPGLTLRVSRAGVAWLMEQHDAQSAGATALLTRLQGIPGERSDAEPLLYEVDLPDGWFRAETSRRCDVWGEASITPGTGIELQEATRVAFPSEMVVSIQGWEGEFWQNPHLTATGEPVPAD